MNKRRLHIIRDTREQDGFTFIDGFDPAPIVTDGTLATGDYSLAGFEAAGITVERKSLQDLVGVLGHGRERFERELARMRAYAVAAVVVEAPLSALRAGADRGREGDRLAADRAGVRAAVRGVVALVYG